MALNSLVSTDITTLPSGDLIAEPCVSAVGFAPTYAKHRLDHFGVGGGFQTITLNSLQANRIGLIAESKIGDAEQNKLLMSWGPLEYELKVTTGSAFLRLQQVYVSIMDTDGNVHYCVGSKRYTPNEPMVAGTYTIEVPIGHDFYGLDTNYTLYWSFKFRNYSTGSQSITLQTGRSIGLSVDYVPITVPLPAWWRGSTTAGAITTEAELEGQGDIDEMTAAAGASGDAELDGLVILEDGTASAGATTEAELDGVGDLEGSASGSSSSEAEFQGTGEFEGSVVASASTEAELEGIGELVLEAIASALGTATLEDASVLTGSYEELANVVRGYFHSAVRGVALVWDNAPDPHTDTLFLRVSIQFRPERTFRVRQHTKYGEILVQIMAPVNSGTQEAMQKADLVAGTFRLTNVNSIRFDTPSLRRVGREGRWYRNDVTCPFRWVA